MAAGWVVPHRREGSVQGVILRTGKGGMKWIGGVYDRGDFQDRGVGKGLEVTDRKGRARRWD
jgi:hypothetical protein